MVILAIPKTIVRAGAIIRDLKEVFEKFDKSSFYFPFGMPSTTRYMSFNQNLPFLIWGSQMKNKAINHLGYNSYVSFTSYDHELNKKNLDTFEEITGERLKIIIPSELEQAIIFSGNTMLEQFLKYPEFINEIKNNNP